MKKTTIFILIASMIVTSVALVILQFRYIKINAEMIENQFNESVQRSLFQTVILVEENEALQYLGQTLEGLDYHSDKNQLQTLEDKVLPGKTNIDSVTDKLQLTAKSYNFV